MTTVHMTTLLWTRLKMGLCGGTVRGRTWMRPPRERPERSVDSSTDDKHNVLYLYRFLQLRRALTATSRTPCLLVCADVLRRWLAQLSALAFLNPIHGRRSPHHHASHKSRVERSTLPSQPTLSVSMGHLVSTLVRSCIAAELAAAHARPAQAEPKRPWAVPTEVVHRFVLFAVDTFLHDFLAESLVLRTEEHSAAYGYSTVCLCVWHGVLRATADTYASSRPKPPVGVGKYVHSACLVFALTYRAVWPAEAQMDDADHYRSAPERVAPVATRDAPDSRHRATHRIRQGWHREVRPTSCSSNHCRSDADTFPRFGARTLRDAVSVLHTYTHIDPDSALLEGASDKPGESPVMRVYHALVVLAREAARADAFPGALMGVVGGQRMMTAAMLPCGIDPWVQCATRNLERCPGVFQLLLRSRVADAVARASIGDAPCFSSGCMRAY